MLRSYSRQSYFLFVCLVYPYMSQKKLFPPTLFSFCYAAKKEKKENNFKKKKVLEMANSQWAEKSLENKDGQC